MHAWLDFDYVRTRCRELRDEAARMRLARTATCIQEAGARLRVAHALFTVGALFVAAGNRVRGDARLAH